MGIIKEMTYSKTVPLMEINPFFSCHRCFLYLSYSFLQVPQPTSIKAVINSVIYFMVGPQCRASLSYSFRGLPRSQRATSRGNLSVWGYWPGGGGQGGCSSAWPLSAEVRPAFWKEAAVRETATTRPQCQALPQKSDLSVLQDPQWR